MHDVISVPDDQKLSKLLLVRKLKFILLHISFFSVNLKCYYQFNFLIEILDICIVVIYFQLKDALIFHHPEFIDVFLEVLYNRKFIYCYL